MQFVTSTREEPASPIALAVLKEVMRFRRGVGSHVSETSHCPSCYQPHFPKILSAIEQESPITFVLPAFPGKSPNLRKVLGFLPDMAVSLGTFAGTAFTGVALASGLNIATLPYVAATFVLFALIGQILMLRTNTKNSKSLESALGQLS